MHQLAPAGTPEAKRNPNRERLAPLETPRTQAEIALNPRKRALGKSEDAVILRVTRINESIGENSLAPAHD